jgi:hypothetical protein
VTARSQLKEPVEQDPDRPWRPGGKAYWDRVRAIVATAPPLTVEQRAELRVLLQPPLHRTEAA